MKSSPKVSPFFSLAITQNILALLILIIIAVIGVLINPEGPNGVHGIFLPNQNYVPAISTQNILNTPEASNIQLLNTYPQDQALSQSRNMGIINTSVHWDVSSSQNNLKLYQESLNQAKFIAAQAGASAIYFLQASEGGAAGSPLDSFAAQFLVLK